MRAVLVKNATIWTGHVDRLEVLKGDIFLNGGLIVGVGVVKQLVLNLHEHNIVDAQVCVTLAVEMFVSHSFLQGAWVSATALSFQGEERKIVHRSFEPRDS
jgi:hypothetical protein